MCCCGWRSPLYGSLHLIYILQTHACTHILAYSHSNAQVVDENEGPQTQREFTTFTVPTGPHLVGKVLDYVCRPSTLFTAGE